MVDHAVMCVHTTLSCACTPCHHVHAHHAIMCMHTTPSCACTPCCHVCTHHIMCMHTMPLCVCTPHHHVCAHHVIMCMHTMPSCVHTPHHVHAKDIVHTMPWCTFQSNLTPKSCDHSNLSDLVRNCEISPKIFPPFKEQSCYNSSAKN